MIVLACGDGGLFCGPLLILGGGALAVWCATSHEPRTKPEGDPREEHGEAH